MHSVCRIPHKHTSPYTLVDAHTYLLVSNASGVSPKGREALRGKLSLRGSVPEILSESPAIVFQRLTRVYVRGIYVHIYIYIYILMHLYIYILYIYIHMLQCVYIYV